jgi:hypothetical protein
VRGSQTGACELWPTVGASRRGDEPFDGEWLTASLDAGLHFLHSGGSVRESLYYVLQPMQATHPSATPAGVAGAAILPRWPRSGALSAARRR